MTAAPGNDEHQRDMPDYLTPYRDAIESHGASFEATGWKNPDMQTGRFDIMIDMANFTGRIVVDAGSGQGALAEHLTACGVQYGRYVGLDAMPEMIEQSRARQIPETQFEVCDFARDEAAFSRLGKSRGGPGVELVVFSGALNTLDEDDAISVLERAWEAAEEGVIFNFLSDRATPELLAKDPAPAKRFDTIRLLDWALSRTPLVRFRQEYFAGHDATIAMFRQG